MVGLWKRVRAHLLFGLTLLSIADSGRAAPTRVANTTLALPQEPYRYSVVDAFPGLTFLTPVAIVSPPGETNRLFVVEKWGAIHVITNLASPTKTLFGFIPADFSGEGGLVGLAFHPGYATNRYFYLFYTLITGAGGFHDRLSRFETSRENPNEMLAGSEVPLITQFDEADDHNAGDLHFGPDGYLYVSLGDEGCCGDAFKNSQRIDKDFFSAILRLDVDKRPGSLPPNPHPAASTNYAVPSDNPFIGATSFNGQPVDPARVRTEFWAIGFRNPWRFSIDVMTGQVYCGDVGQDGREEVDIIVKGGNYGWNYREGIDPFSGTPPQGAAFVEPILDYGHGFGTMEGRAVIGGLVYRGLGIPQLFGEYIFGDFVSGNIWAVHYDGTNASNFRRLTGLVSACAFGTDPSNQDILIATQTDFEDKMYRLVYRTNVTQTLPATLAGTGAFQDLVTLAPRPGIVPYDLNVPFWSDHARKTRWFSVPDTSRFISFSESANWAFPTGTVWIKHFELELTNGVPQSARRLETRFLVRNSGGVYGITYRWDNTQRNASLVPEGGLDDIFLVNDGGTIRTQVWHYPARSECLTCHTPAGGLALGFNTFQLNRDHDHGGTLTNQILALSQMGYFDKPVTTVDGLQAYASATNDGTSVEARVRSYLGANCVQCHQPGGAARGNWDARFTTPLDLAGIVNGSLVNDFGNTLNRVVLPGSLQHSIMFERVAKLGSSHMPPLATSELNQQALGLLRQWITNELAFSTPPVAVDDHILRYLPDGAKDLIAALLSNDFDPDRDPVSFFDVSSFSLNGGSLTRDQDWIYYTPRPGFTDDDSFTYTITDGHGRFATGTVNVIFNPEAPASNLSIVSLGNGSYRIRLNGMPGLTYRIEYTDQLNPPDWRLLAIRTADGFGQFEIVDAPVAGSGQRFYHSIYP